MFTRRTFPRFILNDSLSFYPNNGSEKQLLLKDLSASGAGVFSNCSLKVNEAGNATIIAPAFFDKPVSIKAKVAWCRQVDKSAWEAGLYLESGLYFDTDKIQLHY